MTTQETFARTLCMECGIPYKLCLGTTDDWLALALDMNDVDAKQRVKDWMKKHHWTFVRKEETNTKIHPMLPDTIHHTEVWYEHNNHKIIFTWDD